MKKVKVYNLETRKRSYLVVGTSINDVKEYLEDNKKDLDLSFDMSGHYSVSLNKDISVNWYDMCDDSVDTVNLTDSKNSNMFPKFVTDEAQRNLILNCSLRV